FVGGQALVQDHAPSHVVGALVRKEVAQELGPATRDNAPPGLRVLCEGLALKGIDLVSDDAGDLGFHGRQGNSGGRGDVVAAAKAFERLWRYPSVDVDILRPRRCRRAHRRANPCGHPARSAWRSALARGCARPRGQPFGGSHEPSSRQAHPGRGGFGLTGGGLPLLPTCQRRRCPRAPSARGDSHEVLGSIATAHRPMRALTPERAAFRVARTCYDHLAGALSVALAQRLELDGMVRSANARSYEVTDRGVCWLAEEMDIDVVAL